MLSNEAMKPSKLRRHLETKHAHLKDKSDDFFIRRHNELVTQTKASCILSHHIAKCQEPFTTGEKLVLPSIVSACSEVLGPAAAAKVKEILLSNDTVCRQLDDMAADIEMQITEKAKASDWFAIQLDESTDNSNLAMLLVYITYVHEGQFHEDFLFCKELPGTTTAEKIFQVLGGYITGHGLLWSRCVGVCTDGAVAMTGRHNRVVARVKAVSQSRQSRQCTALSIERCLPLNWSGSRWVQIIIFFFCAKIEVFLTNKQSSLASHLQDQSWIIKVAYLSDILNHFNTMNLSIQVRTCDIFQANDKIMAFKKKLWTNRVNRGVFDMFGCLSSLADEGVDLGEVPAVIAQHLTETLHHFNLYFPSKSHLMEKQWVRDLFANPEMSDLSPVVQDKLLELSCDAGLQSRFGRLSLSEFWLSYYEEYPQLTEMAVKTILPFHSTYLCETTFSQLTSAKTKDRNRLNSENTLRVAVSACLPRFDQLVARKQVVYGPAAPKPDMTGQISLRNAALVFHLYEFSCSCVL
uniref:HAT C-terminal dimerisation domain-containing protein n=1 Tax=Paramormyrops kingsleyae TaxID=1676925 RepID=A0A3B3RDU7_9TELE